MTSSTPYQSALSYISSGGDSSLPKPTQSQQLTFYALYQQEAHGPAKGDAPSRLRVVARAKYDAWKKLGNLSKSDAAARYVASLTSMDPNWQTKSKATQANNIRSKL